MYLSKNPLCVRCLEKGIYTPAVVVDHIIPIDGGDDVLGGDFGGLVRVPAEAVLHVYEPTRPGQLRGVPLLAPVLLRLKTLDDFDDAVLYRQEVANLFAGFIKRPDQNASAGAPSWADQSPAGFTPAVGLEPGTMQELMPGEEVEFPARRTPATTTRTSCGSS